LSIVIEFCEECSYDKTSDPRTETRTPVIGISGMICDQEVEYCEKGEDGRTLGNGD
jgi:hypothetical protein